MQHGGQWLQLESPGGNLILELNYYPRGNRFYEPYRPGSEMDHLGFFVDDVDGWLHRAVHAGAKREADWTESGWRIAYVRDPDGIWLEFIGKTPRPPTRAVRRGSRRKRARGPRASNEA